MLSIISATKGNRFLRRVPRVVSTTAEPLVPMRIISSRDQIDSVGGGGGDGGGGDGGGGCGLGHGGGDGGGGRPGEGGGGDGAGNTLKDTTEVIDGTKRFSRIKYLSCIPSAMYGASRSFTISASSSFVVFMYALTIPSSIFNDIPESSISLPIACSNCVIYAV